MSAFDKNDDSIRAQQILEGYYERLVKNMAGDIVEYQRDFEVPGLGQAEEIIERYSYRLMNFCHVYGALRKPTPREKPVGKVPLGTDEFRCFGCGEVIRRQDENCRTCGWTWKT